MGYVSLIFDILRTTIFLGIIFYILLEYKKRRAFANLINKLPGPKTWPILGNLIQTGAFSSTRKYINTQTVLQQHRRGLCKLFSEHGIFRLWFGPYPFVFIHKPESAKVVLNSNVLIDKSATYNFVAPWLGGSLFLRNGPEWRPLRHVMTPAFHFRILQDFIPIVNTNCELLVDKFRKLCDEEFFDIVPVLTMTTLDIFSESSFGVDLKSQEDVKKRYVEDKKMLLKAAGIRANLPWTIPDFLFVNSNLGKRFKKSLESAKEFAKDIIKAREDILSNKTEEVVEEPKNNEIEENIYFTEKKKRLHALDLLLDREKRNLTSKAEIRGEMDSLILAGHDTTQSSLAFTLFLIGSHPEVQEKIHEELDRVFDGDRHRPVTYEDLSKLNYTDCVIKESLRIFPTVPLIGRSITEDIVVDGHTIPKGAQCTILIQEIHRDPENFPNPEKFDPDRFLLENCRNRHPYAYIPFSAGSRNCLGIKFSQNEEKIMIAIILRNFQIRSLDPVDKLHLVPEVVMSVHNGIRMSFKER